MTTLYIYRTTDDRHVATIEGATNQDCERVAEANGYYPDTDTFGWTYSPAFGAMDGLIERLDAAIIRCS